MTTITRSVESDTDKLNHWFKGDRDAVLLILTLFRVFHVWDDLVDGDKEVTEADINDAFWLVFNNLPSNPFYQRYYNALQPLIIQGIQDWKVANVFERSHDRHRQTIAFTLRCSVLNIIHHCALIIGGVDWADQVGPEIRLYGQEHKLKDYLENLPCQT